MHQAIQHIHDNAELLTAEAPLCDAQGKLTEATVRVLKESGGIRLLQSKDHGGFEEHPNTFFEWVRAVGQYSPSAGWIAGVVGIHPWEIALMDPRLQDEIYGPNGEKADTWTASPYAPIGRAVPVEGGFLFSGDWPYSTGTDYCDWVILGGMVLGEDGNPAPGPVAGGPPDMRHFVLPRGDYEIVEDSWNVMGLSGTGSKNVRMTNAFVPDYRVVENMTMAEGGYSAMRRPGNPLYMQSFSCTFSSAINSGTLGIARGALNAYRDYMTKRVSVSGVVAKIDPYQQQRYAEAEADWSAAVRTVEDWTNRMFDQAVAGQAPTRSQRLEQRRDQVRGVQNVLDSIDDLFKIAGSSAVWTDKPLERYWRDLRAGGSHICNIYDTLYSSWVNFEFETGGPVVAFH